ncbi:hypothetical protein ACJX0J_035495, partial [Zea mays]
DSGIMFGSQEELLKGIWKAGIKLKDDNLESIDLLEKDKGKEAAPYMQDDHGSNSDFLYNEEGKKKREKRLGIKISPIGKGQENPDPNRKKTKGLGKKGLSTYLRSLITQHKLAFLSHFCTKNNEPFLHENSTMVQELKEKIICLNMLLMFQDLHEGKLNHHEKNETEIFLKLDFEKAYDKVNWNFMHKRI